jgi:hypothetical protein
VEVYVAYLTDSNHSEKKIIRVLLNNNIIVTSSLPPLLLSSFVVLMQESKYRVSGARRRSAGTLLCSTLHSTNESSRSNATLIYRFLTPLLSYAMLIRQEWECAATIQGKRRNVTAVYGVVKAAQHSTVQYRATCHRTAVT